MSTKFSFSLLAASIVEQPARNPYWSALKARFPRKCFLSRSATTCSKIFPIVSSMQNDRNKTPFPTGLPCFCKSTGRATIHWVGNNSLFSIPLKTTSSIPRLARCSMVHPLFGMLSGPGAFLALAHTWSTAALISSAINSGSPSSFSRQCWELREQLVHDFTHSFRLHTLNYGSTPTFFITILYGRPYGSSST